ncbi:MAG TPA: NAD-binding protein [Solirubrobacteraceae bacterium]|nr:NAD-binding protein [Solirubrobacteraceae bacterium]
MLTTGALVLLGGFTGYRKLGYTASESLYGAVSQFVPGAFLLTLDGNNWELEITRAVGPILTGYAVLQGLLALTRQHARLLWLRMAGRNHIVIAGLGTVGSVLAESLQEAGNKVVAVEAEGGSEQVGNARDSGIPVVIGSAVDRTVMRAARLGQAGLLVVTTGDDTRNLDVLPVAAELLPRRRREALTVLIQLNDRTLWHVLRAHGFWIERERRLRVELFNLFDLAARRLLERFAPFGSQTPGGSPNTNVLIVGFDGVAPTLIPEIARAWQYHERRPAAELRITVVDPDAVAHCAWLLGQHPDLEQVCELVPLSLDVEGPGFQRGDTPIDLPADYELGAIYVCHTQDVRAVSAAFALSQRPETSGALTVVTLTDPRSGVASMIDSSRRTLTNLHTFSLLTGTLDPELLRSGVNEQIAQANHAQYVRSQRALGHTLEDNPSLVEWDELPESLKQSNRLFADGVGSKLEAAGCRLVPASLTPRHGFQFREDELEELAKLEHDRWVADLRGQGWRPTEGEKDPQHKRHPLLVTWEELSEAERDKDRMAVRQLPEMLLRAGFEIYREGDQAASASSGKDAAKLAS